jgi:hypothetical protein
VSVTAASVQDRDGAHPVMANGMEKYSSISKVFLITHVDQPSRQPGLY